MNSKFKALYHENMFLASIGRLLMNYKNYPHNNYHKICSERSQYDIWDYKAISEDLDVFIEDISPDAAAYGSLHWFKEYANVYGRINAYVEHGLYFGNLVRQNAIHSIYDATLTFSARRASIIKKRSKKKVFPLGPYIHYATDYYSESYMAEIKLKFGKTLLFFPPHSGKNDQAEYEIEKICKRLECYKERYQTIMICLYHLDIKNGAAAFFEKFGFMVVSAGEGNDYHFLSRLRSIIRIADHTVSMCIGTHIGYCIYLGKSHEIINEDFCEVDFTENNKLFNLVNEKDDIHQRGANYMSSFQRDEMRLLRAFFSKGEKIQEKQIEVCDKYWGFNDVKTPKQLKSILESMIIN